MTGEKSAEFRGKSVEAAVNAGLAELRLSRDEVEIEVVRPGSRGVLGIGAEDAVVRLTALRPPKPEPKPAPRPEPHPTPRPQRESSSQTPKVSAAVARPAPEPVPHTAAESETPRPVRQEPAAAANKADEKALAAAQQGREFLAGLLERMNLQADIEIIPQSDAEADEDSRVQVLNIVGGELGVLIGRQNETLAALEFITRLMVNQESHIRSNFIVDVNGYRAKRADSLRKLALRMAEQAVQSNRTMVLEPMSPAERRIIHLALRDHPKVYTQSVGEGDRRKVTVIPKRD